MKSPNQVRQVIESVYRSSDHDEQKQIDDMIFDFICFLFGNDCNTTDEDSIILSSFDLYRDYRMVRGLYTEATGKEL
jgi:hypothetical protein